MTGVSNGVKMRKSVSFAGLNSMREWKVSTVKDCLRYMQQGSDFVKLRRKNQHFNRFYWLSPSNDEIRWSPSSKKGQQASLRLGEIREVRMGMNTETFRAHDLAKKHSENCALSIMHGPDFVSLDLIAKSAEIASIWVAGLTALINEARNQRGPDAKGILSPPDSLSTSSESNEPSSCFSYALSSTTMTAAMIVPIPIEADSGAFDLSAAQGSRKEADSRDRWLRELFLNADLTQDGVLSHSDAIRLMKNFGSGLGTIRIKQKLEEVGVIRNGMSNGHGYSDGHHSGINLDQFLNVMKETFSRPDIYFLMIRYSSNAEYLTLSELINFMESEQGVRLSNDEALALISKHEPSLTDRAQMRMTVDGLVSLLNDPVNNCLFDPQHNTICQDMTLPLSHYYIYASHKTYLMEDQLTGPSSIEGYVTALRAGARYVEVDVHDGNTPEGDAEPFVYHGNTLTSKISLRAVLETISKHAFERSEYPLIIAMQVHCSLKQQLKVAKLLTSLLGDMLYPSAGEAGADTAKILPSPEKLRRRILIKMTTLRKSMESNTRPQHGTANGHDDATKRVIIVKKLRDGTEIEYGCITDEDVSDDEPAKKNGLHLLHHHHKKDKKQRLLKQLAELAILNSVRYKNHEQSCNLLDVYSLTEKAAMRIATTKAEELVSLTKHNLFRVQPSQARVDSSNMDAQYYLNCGCQLVTMNLQSPGPYIDVYRGFFKKNGACGYVLKPLTMRDAIARFNANLTVSAPDNPTQLVSVKVLSAQYIPTNRSTVHAAGESNGVGVGSAVHPMVVCQMFGVPIDRSQQASRVLDQPTESFNTLVYETFHFLVSVPQLATLRFLVLDGRGHSEKERFVAQACVPVECLRNGYRVLPLNDFDGSPLPVTVFVHVSITNHCNAIPVRPRSSTSTAMARSASSARDLSALRGRGRAHSQVGRSVTLSGSASFSVPTVASSQASHYYNRDNSGKETVAVKTVGVKQVDELFKQAANDMERALALREAVSVSFATLKQMCGLDMKVSARHCLRYLIANVVAAPPARRRSLASASITNSTPQSSPYSVVMNGNQIEVTNRNSTNSRDVHLAPAFEQVVSTVNRLMRDCQSVTEQANVLVEKLSNIYDRAVDLYAELPTLCDGAGIKAKRLQTAMDHFAWNVRAVKGQAEMLRGAKTEAADIMQQVRTTVQYQTGSGSGHDAPAANGVGNGTNALTSVTFNI